MSRNQARGKSMTEFSTHPKSPGDIFGPRNLMKISNFPSTIKLRKNATAAWFFRTDPKNPVQGGFEIQVASRGLYSGKHIVGSLYDAKSPSESAGKPDGEWNQMKITCVGPNIQVVLNGKNVLNANLDKWTTPKLNPDGTKNKFKTALKKLPRTGNIGFQYHGHPVWFRNVVIKKK